MTRDEWNKSETRPRMVVVQAKAGMYAQEQCSNPACGRHAAAWDRLYMDYGMRSDEP